MCASQVIRAVRRTTPTKSDTMSELNFFLVPEDEPGPGQRGVGEIVLRYLEDKGIIEGFYGQEHGWFAAGPRSNSLFVGRDADGPAFEYVIIYDRAAAHFVPDTHTGGVGAKCRSCEAGIDEAIYDFLEEQGEGEEAQDVADTTLVCGSCGHANPLRGLDAEAATAVTRFFLNFCIVDTFELSQDIVRDLEALVGAPLRLIEERM